MKDSTISEQLFLMTVRIDTANLDSVKGAGTGFLFCHQYGKNFYTFIVTNKHVVNGAIKGSISFLRKGEEGAELGKIFRYEVDNFESIWHGHEDQSIDIAVTPFRPIRDYLNSIGIEIYHRTASTEHTLFRDDFSEIDALEEVVFVGYPNGIWDTINFLPIMRRGTTATPLSVDFQGEKKFLIDASVFGGSSGSPVYTYNKGIFVSKSGQVQIGVISKFIGVVASVFYKSDVNEIIEKPIPTTKGYVALGKQMIDLGVVFKAETVVEAIEQVIRKHGNA